MARLKATVETALFKLVLAWSLIVLVGFAWKLGVWYKIADFAGADGLGEVGKWLTAMAAPLELSGWQVAAAINSLLAWGLFFRADGLIKQRANGLEVSTTAVAREWAFFQTIRTTLSLYTIACTVYITAAVAWSIDWPPVRFILVPWSAGG